MIFTGRVGNSCALPLTAAMLRKNAEAIHIALFLYAIIGLLCAVVNCAPYALGVLEKAPRCHASAWFDSRARAPLRMLPERYFRKQIINPTAHAPPWNGPAWICRSRELRSDGAMDA
jgi:hypothetical protein